MMDDRAITEYKMIIKVRDKEECAQYNPFGLCYVEDCMTCPNAKVKMIREDGVVMRDDFKNKNNWRENKIQAYKQLLEKENIEFFENMHNVKFTKWQKWYLKRLSRRLTKNK